MSKGGAKARHSVRNWRFYVAAHDTRASNRDPGPGPDITDLLGKLPRNVSDHENPQYFPGEIDCTLVRTLAWDRDDAVSMDGPEARRRSAQFPDTASRETDDVATARAGGGPILAAGRGRQLGSHESATALADRRRRPRASTTRERPTTSFAEPAAGGGRR
jgi:hypothetical protein